MARLTGIPDHIHEVGCYDCLWCDDMDAAVTPDASRQMVAAVKRHVDETGHVAWKHSIRLWTVTKED